MSLPVFTLEQVSKHNSLEDCWIVIDDGVYDVSKFMALHPGGRTVFYEYQGKDATEEFHQLHKHEVLLKYKNLKVGTCSDKKPVDVKPFLSLRSEPYSELKHLVGFHSKYYDESHKTLHKELRLWLRNNIVEEAERCEENGKFPSEKNFLKVGAHNLFPCMIGPGPHLKMIEKFGGKLPGGVKAEKFDHFHELVCHYETANLGCIAYSYGIFGGFTIGCPALAAFGSNELRMATLPTIFTGNKKICLAISEPYAGSDVSTIRTKAVKSDCGKFYIVTGLKKWITSGMYSDYFVTAVRTGGPGVEGISLLLVERDNNLTTKHIKTSQSGTAGTSLVIYDGVKVPVGNLLGKENEGFKCIMFNFNHERWLMNINLISYGYQIISECFKWCMVRRAFGKRLIDQPVIREKLAHMCASVESISSWLESITYNMDKMDYLESAIKLSGPIALHKMECGAVGQMVINEACQIFGGRGITKNGMGKYVERMYRSYKFSQILGGTDEIMADLGAKQAIRGIPKKARL